MLAFTRVAAQSCRVLELTGEVSAANEWSAPIGQGWLFRVVPIPGSVNGAQRYSGWDLVVSPAGDSGYPDALLLATPPYGSLNQHEIATTYGLRAQDAIAWSPRRFQFLTSATELARARGLYGQVMKTPASGHQSTQSSADAMELLNLATGSPSLGRGEFVVLDAKLIGGVADPPNFARQWAPRLSQIPHTLAPAGLSPSPRGELLRLRFKAVLQLPEGWKLPPGAHSVDAKCAQ